MFALAASIVSTAFVIRRSQELGIKVSFYALQIACIIIVTTLQGRTHTASFSVLVISAIAIAWLLPLRSRLWYSGVAAGTFGLMWVIEWIDPAWRVVSDAATIGPAAVMVFVVILSAILLNQAWDTLSLRWKMGTIVAVLFLGMAVVAYMGYSGLRALRYQLSNIYDFMLVPIVDISNAQTRLTENQYIIQQIHTKQLSGIDIEQSIGKLRNNDALAAHVIARYQNEWVTTVSPEFTQILRDAGRIDLQQQEVAVLNELIAAFDQYQEVNEQFLSALQAGNSD
jgi:hypothetical protein